MSKIYYLAPTQECFDDMKRACIAVWESKDDTYGYATEKINRIKHITNVQDNFMYMLAMFDEHNQKEVVSRLNLDTKVQLLERLVDGGNDLAFMGRIGL